jgi:CspA family cold shock protein
MDMAEDKPQAATTAEPMVGTVRTFDPDAGEGLIVADEGGEYYVHASKVEHDGYPPLSDGQKVQFYPAQGAKGPAALKVKVVAG